MKKLDLSITCPKCHGTGRTLLTPDLTRTLEIVRQKGKIDAVSLREIMDGEHAFHATAYNNRLNELMELGFVTRTRSGRVWLYEVTKNGKSK